MTDRTTAEQRAAERAERARRWTVLGHAILAGEAPADAHIDDYDWDKEPPE